MRFPTFRSFAASVCAAVRTLSVVALPLTAMEMVSGQASAQFAVSSTQPSRNAVNVGRSAPISVTFDRPVNMATFTAANFKVFGKLSGPIAGVGGVGGLVVSNSNRTVTLTPARPLMAGESVMVVMSRNLRASDGTFLRSAGYTFEFTTAAAAANRVFRRKATVSNRDGTGDQTRIYGGLACDLNRDGWCDITTINEVSADMRTFLNRADGSGLMQPMVTPYTTIPEYSSPNDVADFDGDGFIDAVTSSDGTSEIAICMGNGNGTFRTPVLAGVGSNPRGFGILDADGDGDLDITVANANSNTVSLLLNNGAGVFSAPTSIAVAGGPYGMMAADMTNDGILDLAIGCRSDQTVKILRGNGNGTFTQVSSRSIGGQNWVVVCGDVNNDGNMDVSAANSFSANGAILLGNGNGTLQAATVYSIGGHSVSTDLADLDGDGYLDWILSSFGAGTWYAYLNDHTGHFTPLVNFPAPANPSCCVPGDMDNDGDIDLVLTDEIADVLIFMMNVCPADYDDGSGTGIPDGGVGIEDLLYYLDIYDDGSVEADLDNGTGTGVHDGGVGIEDLLYYLERYDDGC